MKRKKRDNIAHRSDNPSWNNWFPKYKSGPYIYLDSLLTGNPRIDNVPYGEGAKNYLSKLFGIDDTGEDHYMETFQNATNMLLQVADSESRVEQEFINQNILGDKLVVEYLKGNRGNSFSAYIDAFNSALNGRREYLKRLNVIKSHYKTTDWTYTQAMGGYVHASINRAYRHENIQGLNNAFNGTTFEVGKTDADMSALVRILIMRELHNRISTLSDLSIGAITGIIQTVILPELEGMNNKGNKGQTINKVAIEQLVRNHPLIQRIQQDNYALQEIEAIGAKVLASYRIKNKASSGEILASTGEIIDAITGTVVEKSTKQIYEGNTYSFDGRNTGIGGEVEDRLTAIVANGLTSMGSGRQLGKIDTILEYTVGNIRLTSGNNNSFNQLTDLIDQRSIAEMKKRGTIYTDLYSQIDKDLRKMEQVNFIIHENIKDWSSLNTKRTSGVDLGNYGTTLTSFLSAIDALSEAGFNLNDIVMLKTLILNSVEESVIGTQYLDPLTKYLSAYATMLTFDDAADMVYRSTLSTLGAIDRSNLKVIHVFKVNGILYPASVLLELTAKNLSQAIQEVQSLSSLGGLYKIEFEDSDDGNEDPYELLAEYDAKKIHGMARWHGIVGNGEEGLKLRITALHALVNVINNLGLNPIP